MEGPNEGRRWVSQMKILLLDDVMFEVVVPWLEARGHVVDTAVNSWEARTLYEKSGPYDLVLTDVDHPGMNGIDLAAAIRRLNPAQHIGVLTTYYVPQYPTLVKPFFREALLKFVDSFASGVQSAAIC
jgi:CheY-like chemotaxis protein